MSHALTYAVAFGGFNEVKFKTQQDAENFAEQLCTEAQHILETLLKIHFEEIQSDIQKTQTDLNNIFIKETKVIFEETRDRLNEAFDVGLELPPLILEEGINKDYLSPKVSVEKRNKNPLEKTVDFFKSLFNFKKSEQDENLYTVSLEKTVKQINRSIDNKIQETKDSIKGYLDKDFQQTLDEFFNKLDDYLQGYQDSLTQALKDKGSSLGSQEELKSVLDNFAQQADNFLEEVNPKLRFTNENIKC